MIPHWSSPPPDRGRKNGEKIKPCVRASDSADKMFAVCLQDLRNATYDLHMNLCRLCRNPANTLRKKHRSAPRAVIFLFGKSWRPARSAAARRAAAAGRKLFRKEKSARRRPGRRRSWIFWKMKSSVLAFDRLLRGRLKVLAARDMDRFWLRLGNCARGVNLFWCHIQLRLYIIHCFFSPYSHPRSGRGEPIGLTGLTRHRNRSNRTKLKPGALTREGGVYFSSKDPRRQRSHWEL